MNFELYLNDENNILAVIHQSSCDMDHISNNLIISAGATSTKSLPSIINQISTNGIFPDKLKAFKVSVMFKKRTRTL